MFVNNENATGLVPQEPNFTQFNAPVRARARPARIVWEQTALPLAASRLRIDVLLNAGFTAPLLARCPQVTVFHDLQYKRHPEYYKPFELPIYRFLLYWAARRSSRIVADSEATASDLRHYLAFTKNKVAVIHLGVEPQFFAIARRRWPREYILTVSTLHPHKNLPRLLRAFAIFRQTHPAFRLVVCGLHGFVSKPIHDLRNSLGLTYAVDFPGWIPREELHELYAGAWSFVCPSLFEGFGLPLLEAMAAGIPTACSAIEPFISIAAGAAVLFDPGSVQQMADTMARITDDSELRSSLSKAGRERADGFSWDATAAATMRTLASARDGDGVG